MCKHVSPWIYDEGGTSIPDISPEAMHIVDQLSDDIRKEVFTAKSYDPNFNYEDLEFLGDPALRLLVSQMIQDVHRELATARKIVSFFQTHRDQPLTIFHLRRICETDSSPEDACRALVWDLGSWVISGSARMCRFLKPC